MARNKKISLPIIIALTCLTTVLTIYIARGWIRESFLPNQASYFAKKSLHKAYKQSYESVRQPMEELKISLSANVVTKCHVFAAEGVQTTVSCSNSSGDALEISDEYIQTFKQNSLKIEQKILQSGWTKTWNAHQPINELFNNPFNDVSVGVNYEKKYDKNICTLSLFYNAYQKNPSELRYSLSCYRYLSFLGNPDK